MVIRRALPLQWLVLRAIEDGDESLTEALTKWGTQGAYVPDATDARALAMAVKIERVIVEGMFVRPRVWWDREDMPPSSPIVEGEIPVDLFVADLHDDELTEIVNMAMEGVADAARFRAEPGSADGGAGGKRVGSKAKSAPKPRSRKR